MSLTDKVIKNSLFYLVSQVIGFLIPLILTPVIIANIGEAQFGVYAIIMGFTGAVGILDMSISTSFIKFISEYYLKNNFQKLNQFISTGFIYYFLTSLVIFIIGYLLSEKIIGLFNIPAGSIETAVFAFKISLVTFFISNITTIFTCILFSRHQIYRTSMVGIFLHTAFLVFTIILLYNGFGLAGLFYVQLGFALCILLLNYIVARKALPEMRLSLFNFHMLSFKQMFSYGTQMQVSRLSGILSEKYDEFLLGFYSTMNNVAYFNIAAKVTKAGRFFPMQFIPQIGSAASELKAKENEDKLAELFESFTRYMTILVMPIYLFIFFFSDFIITAWLGEGYEISSYILKILCAGQLINLIASVPGNTILPGIGFPKFSMYEGLINLGLNVVISFFLIKYYGITGAALGAAIAMGISSAYIFSVSVKFFKKDPGSFMFRSFFIPVIVCASIIILLYILSQSVIGIFDLGYGRTVLITVILISGIILTVLYSLFIIKLKYVRPQDKVLLKKTGDRVPILKHLIRKW